MCLLEKATTGKGLRKFDGDFEFDRIRDYGVSK